MCTKASNVAHFDMNYAKFLALVKQRLGEVFINNVTYFVQLELKCQKLPKSSNYNKFVSKASNFAQFDMKCAKFLALVNNVWEHILWKK